MKTFFALALFFSSTVLYGQKNTYLGFEASITNDKYKVTDNGNKINTNGLINGSWGINLGQEINDYLRIETGIIRKYYSQGINFESSHFGFNLNAIDSWQIPLRLRGKLNLINKKLFLTGFVGYHYCINSNYKSYGHGGGVIRGGADSISFNYTSNTGLAKHFSLIETGLGLEIKLFRKALLTFSASYFAGFNDVIQLNINYQYKGQQPMNAKAISKGNYWSFGAGLRYPISDIWKNKKE